MSLRLKLALAIATIAGLVAGLTGVVVYDREKSDRHDRARRSVAQNVRLFAQILNDPDLTSAPAAAIVESANGPDNPRIPQVLRAQLTDRRVYSLIANVSGTPIVIAGTRLPDGQRVYATGSF